MADEQDEWDVFIKDDIAKQETIIAKDPYLRGYKPQYFYARTYELEVQNGAIHICELRYYRNNDDRQPIEIEIRVFGIEDQFLNHGLPYRYEFVESGRVENIGPVAPEIRVVAAPGVSIQLPADFEDWPDEKSIRYPSINIIRVQSPFLVPQFPNPIVEGNLLLPELFCDGQSVTFEEAKALAKKETDLDKSASAPADLNKFERKFPQNTIYVQNLKNGALLYCPAVKLGALIEVASYDISENDEDSYIDALAKFEYQIVEGSRVVASPYRTPRKDDPGSDYFSRQSKLPLVIIAATSDVSIKLLDYSGTSLFPDEEKYIVMQGRANIRLYDELLKRDDLANPFYFVIVKDDESIPGKPIFPYKEDLLDLFWKSTGSSKLPKLPKSAVIDYYSDSFCDFITPELAVYTGLNIVFSDIMDVAEFIYATFSGKDFLGQELTLGEYILLFIYVMPAVPGAASKLAKKNP